MEPVLTVTEGADLMEWASALRPPVASGTDLYATGYTYSSFGTLNPLNALPVQASDPLLPFEPVDLGPDAFTTFKIPDKPISIPNMADWPDVPPLTMRDDAEDNTFEFPGFGSPSRAPSVGSGHLSIGSAGSSNHSWSSWRGRSRIKKVFSRGSSIAGRAKSTMKDGMSNWSLNGTNKHVSPSPRRAGKLTDAARAGMRLLKGQGACWKCKILKKTCDPSNICKECTSSTKVAWQKVGCRRGALGTNYKPVEICHSSYKITIDSQSQISEEEDWAAKQAEANRLWEEEMQTRCAEVGTTRLKIHRQSYSSHFTIDRMPALLLKRAALKQQLVKAMKELAPSLEEPKRKQEVFMLLYHASLYDEYLDQSRLHTCHLSHLSIRCINHSLDALRSPPRLGALHRGCKPDRCGLHAIAKLQQSLTIYMNTLHNVMFSKWGLSNHRHWWLAIFYSLCIQSLVRVNLIKLNRRVDLPDFKSQLSAKFYLHLFIDLFEAASADYDPIMAENVPSPEEMVGITLARIAVNPWHWEEQGIRGSYDHLRRIFEVKLEKHKSVGFVS